MKDFLTSDLMCLFWSIRSFDKAEIFRIFHDKFSLLMRRCSEHGSRNLHYIILDLDQTHTKLLSRFNKSEETEIRFPFYWSFSTFWNVPGSLCTKIIHLCIRIDLK